MSKKGIAGIAIVLALIAVYLGIQAYASNVAQAKVDAAISKASGLASIDYDKVSVDLIGRDVRISHVSVSPVKEEKKMMIREITIHDFDDKAEIPAFLSVSCNGIEFSLANLEGKARRIKDLGYSDKVLIDVDVDYSYDREKKELYVKKIGLEADEVGDISFSFRFGNIDLYPDQIAGLLFTIPQVVLREAKIRYEDDSLFDRLIKLGAQESHMDETSFRRLMTRQVERAIAKENSEPTKKTLAEIAGFLEDPENLSISASPSAPLPLGRLMRTKDPKEIIELLNIRITS